METRANEGDLNSCPQLLNLTNEQVAFAIISALGTVPTPSASLPVVAVQGVPSKAQRKLGAHLDPKLGVKLAVVAQGVMSKAQCKLGATLGPKLDVKLAVAVQGVLLKAQHKVGAKLNPKLDGKLAVIGHKRKHPMKMPSVPSTTMPPFKKMKTSEEPQKQVSTL